MVPVAEAIFIRQLMNRTHKSELQISKNIVMVLHLLIYAVQVQLQCNSLLNTRDKKKNYSDATRT